MASKGQKFQKYNQNIKDEVLKQYLNGVSSWYLERIYGIPYKTIQTWEEWLNILNFIQGKD